MDRPGTPVDAEAPLSLAADMARAGDLAARLERSLRALVDRMPIGDDADQMPRRVAALIRFRRARDKLLGEALFADPAWDILLDLFLAELEQRERSVSAVCIAAAVPATTALRWIKALEVEKHLVRETDANDPRRVNLRLTKATSERMRKLMALC